MFLSDSSYKDAVQKTLNSASHADMAVAFWGHGAEKLFSQWHGGALRIICNLAMGGTNPTVIEKLQKVRGAEVKQLSTLHAKVLLTDLQLVMGSANMSANGLGFEDNESAAWQEAGIQSSDPALIQQSSQWFEAQWQTASAIRPDDIKTAWEAWAKRRKQRPATSRAKGVSWLDLTAEQAKDRPYYLMFYQGSRSQDADKAVEAKRDELKSAGRSSRASSLDAYEHADEMQRAVLSDPDALLLQIYLGSKGRVKVEHIQSTLPKFQQPTLDFVMNLTGKLCPFKFDSAERAKWRDELLPWLQSDAGNSAPWLVPVSDFLSWREQQW